MNKSKQKILDKLRSTDPHSFEHCISDIWQQFGWSTEVTSKSQDGGIDVIARKESRFGFQRKQYIQAKCYEKGNRVSVTAVRECASLHNKSEPEKDQVDTVVIVTTSDLTQKAKKEAEEKNVKTVIGRDLAQLVDEENLHGIVKRHTGIDKSSTRIHSEELSTNNKVSQYRNSRQWKMIEDYNEKASVMEDENLILKAKLGDNIAYKLYHGICHSSAESSHVNVHILPEPTKAQKLALDRFDTVSGIHLINNPEEKLDLFDDSIEERVKIYQYELESDPDSIRTRETVSIGHAIIDLAYDQVFSDINMEIERVGNE